MRYISYNTIEGLSFGKGSSVTNSAFELELYETADGKSPAADFLDSLDPKMRAKMIGLMVLLEEKGSALRYPYSSALNDGIFELRGQFGSNISRALYFFYAGHHIVVTNGFVKKTQRTPPGEIKLAKERRKEWIKRHISADQNSTKEG